MFIIKDESDTNTDNFCLLEKLYSLLLKQKYHDEMVNDYQDVYLKQY